MKIYVITLAKTFPAWHPRKGEPTGFLEKFLNGQTGKGNAKLHTIRANYPLWEKRIREVQNGKAVLSVRQRLGGYSCASKQVTVATLTAADGVGIQKLEFYDGRIIYPTIGEYNAGVKEIANKDGLYTNDWVDWFKGYDMTKPLAIIHFTSFRY